jgi:hypothetical protein
VTTDLIKATLLTLLPTDGSTVGNTSLRRTLEAALAGEDVTITEDDYWTAQTALIEACPSSNGLRQMGEFLKGEIGSLVSKFKRFQFDVVVAYFGLFAL